MLKMTELQKNSRESEYASKYEGEEWSKGK